MEKLMGAELYSILHGQRVKTNEEALEEVEVVVDLAAEVVVAEAVGVVDLEASEVERRLLKERKSNLIRGQ